MTSLVSSIVRVLRQAERTDQAPAAQSRAQQLATEEAQVQGWLTRENTLTDTGRAALERLERDLG